MKMASVINLIAVIGFISMASAAAGPAYLIPVEHRSLTGYKEIQPISELPPNTLYEYQIVPRDQYTIAEYDSSDVPLWDYIPSPSTVLSCVASKALSVGKWVVTKGVFVLLGVGLVFGFCAFTPYCTLTIYKPFFGRDSRAIVTVPYMDEIESFLQSAYDKYEAMNEIVKKN